MVGRAPKPNALARATMCRGNARELNRSPSLLHFRCELAAVPRRLGHGPQYRDPLPTGRAGSSWAKAFRNVLMPGIAEASTQT